MLETRLKSCLREMQKTVEDLIYNNQTANNAILTIRDLWRRYKLRREVRILKANIVKVISI